jgi:hypothetical protein
MFAVGTTIEVLEFNLNINFATITTVRMASSVSIVTGYGPDGGVAINSRQRQEYFIFSTACRTAL